MQLLHIRNRIHLSSRLEDVGILGIELGRDDTGFVFAGFEMRVREAEEDGGELGEGEVVGEEFHGVGAEGGNVLISVGRVLGAKGGDAVCDVVEDLGAEFHAWSESVCQELNVCGRTDLGNGYVDLPTMSVSGKRGLRAIRRPPKPQPMSATSTGFAGAGGVVWLSALEPSMKAGYSFDQSISKGLAGLETGCYVSIFQYTYCANYVEPIRNVGCNHDRQKKTRVEKTEERGIGSPTATSPTIA